MPSVAVLPAVSPEPQCPHTQSQTTTKTNGVEQGAHTYKPQGEGELRSVCPALNTLANHSYLPHDGKHITPSNLANALHAGYGISIGFAYFLVAGTYYLLKHNPLKPLDLHDIGLHNGVEHNSSVVHDDADGQEYAPSPVDEDLLQKFLKKSYTPSGVRALEDEDMITVEDLAYTRVARQAVCGPIDSVHAEIARGEFAMVFDIFGEGNEKKLKKKDLEAWLKVNRFPEGWTPNHTETLWQTVTESKRLRELTEVYQNAGQDGHHGLWASIEKALGGVLSKAGATAHVRGADLPNGTEKMKERDNI